MRTMRAVWVDKIVFCVDIVDTGVEHRCSTIVFLLPHTLTYITQRILLRLRFNGITPLTVFLKFDYWVGVST
jgi:hypothetical protein